MTPLSPKDHNKTFVKPEGWTDAEGTCSSLAVKVVDRVGKLSLHISQWKPDPEELALLNAGGVVQLTVKGCQPPVALSVQP